MDSAANSYLTAAFLLAAGMEGVVGGWDPGDPIEDLVYDWGTSGTIEPNGQIVVAGTASIPGTFSGTSQAGAEATKLPRNLLEAVEAFDADPLTRQVFPRQFVDSYIEMKLKEWDAYHAQVSDWERNTYLEMF